MILIVFLILSHLCFGFIQHYRLSGPYLNGLDDGLEDWTRSPSVSIVEKFIRLTPLETGKSGYIWTKTANVLEDWEANFEIYVYFYFFIGFLIKN